MKYRVQIAEGVFTTLDGLPPELCKCGQARKGQCSVCTSVREERRTQRKAIGKAACVCWDYETPDAECTCGAY